MDRSDFIRTYKRIQCALNIFDKIHNGEEIDKVFLFSLRHKKYPLPDNTSGSLFMFALAMGDCYSALFLLESDYEDISREDALKLLSGIPERDTSSLNDDNEVEKKIKLRCERNNMARKVLMTKYQNEESQISESSQRGRA